MSNVFVSVLFILLCLLIIGAGPLITIWSLNTLFLLGIGYNLKTWFATLFLTSILAARKISK